MKVACRRSSVEVQLQKTMGRCASGRLACTQCRTAEFSDESLTIAARQASRETLRAAIQTWVWLQNLLELIAHLDCGSSAKSCDAHAEEECG